MAKDLGTDGVENQIKGAAKEVAGKVRKNVGDLTDNHSEEMKGKAKELEGKAQLRPDLISHILRNSARSCGSSA